MQIQMHPGVPWQQQPPTVERALMDGLAAWGGIATSNAFDPKKNGWSRSSRTDKVIDCPLAVDETVILLTLSLHDY